PVLLPPSNPRSWAVGWSFPFFTFVSELQRLGRRTWGDFHPRTHTASRSAPTFCFSFTCLTMIHFPIISHLLARSTPARSATPPLHHFSPQRHRYLSRYLLVLLFVLPFALTIKIINVYAGCYRTLPLLPLQIPRRGRETLFVAFVSFCKIKATSTHRS